MSQIPATMKALVQNEGERSASVKEVPVPKLGPEDLLVKVEYAAQNPTDWKHVHFLSPPGATLGCDFSGTVVAVGPDLVNPSIKVGDRVASAVHGGIYPDRGSFAEYLKVHSDLVFKVPNDLDMAEAATFGIGFATSFHALIYSQGQPFPPAKVDPQPYLIYGAASSVGMFATQLATIMGYQVIAVCSPSNFDLVKSLGAVHCVDYHDADKCVETVQKLSGGKIALGFDTISQGEESATAVKCFGEKGGQLNVILQPSGESPNPNVKRVHTLMYAFYGKEFDMNPVRAAGPEPMLIKASPKERAFGAEVFARAADMITKFGMKGNPVTIRGTLDDITAGFKEHAEGKVRATKLVYKIA